MIDDYAGTPLTLAEAELARMPNVYLTKAEPATTEYERLFNKLKATMEGLSVALGVEMISDQEIHDHLQEFGYQPEA